MFVNILASQQKIHLFCCNFLCFTGFFCRISTLNSDIPSYTASSTIIFWVIAYRLDTRLSSWLPWLLTNDSSTLVINRLRSWLDWWYSSVKKIIIFMSRMIKYAYWPWPSRSPCKTMLIQILSWSFHYIWGLHCTASAICVWTWSDSIMLWCKRVILL